MRNDYALWISVDIFDADARGPWQRYSWNLAETTSNNLALLGVQLADHVELGHDQIADLFGALASLANNYKSGDGFGPTDRDLEEIADLPNVYRAIFDGVVLVGVGA